MSTTTKPELHKVVGVHTGGGTYFLRLDCGHVVQSYVPWPTGHKRPCVECANAKQEEAAEPAD